MHKIYQKVIDVEKSQGTFEKPKSYQPPIRQQDVIEKLYKKQLPDVAGHLEMVEKLKGKTSKPKAEKKGGAQDLIKPPLQFVEGSRPLEDISAKQQYIIASGKPGDKMKRRGEKIKELMKSKGMSMTEASKYIKANKIQY
jgi:hypothetical protein